MSSLPDYSDIGFVRARCQEAIDAVEADAAVIRAAYERDGELSAVIELRRLFPGIADNENARICARTIAGWAPLPAPTHSVVGRSGFR